MTDYGFKIGLRVSLFGMVTHCPLLDARSHDINHAEELLEGAWLILKKGLSSVDTTTFVRRKQAPSRSSSAWLMS